MEECEVPVTVVVPSCGQSAVSPSPLTVAAAAALPVSDVLGQLGSGPAGLPEDEAHRRLQAAGPNAVRSHRARAMPVLARQLRSPLLVLLAVTALASAFVGQASDAVIIGTILLASALLCLARPCLAGAGDGANDRGQRQPQPYGHDHGREVSEGPDPDVGARDAGEDHQQPCADEEGWPGRHDLEEVIH